MNKASGIRPSWPSFSWPAAAKRQRTASADEQVVPSAAGQPKVTFIELGSVNCIPCKVMQPVMREIEQRFPRDVKVVFYDVWTESSGNTQPSSTSVSSRPRCSWTRRKEFLRHEGFFPKEELITMLKKRGVSQ